MKRKSGILIVVIVTVLVLLVFRATWSGKTDADMITSTDQSQMEIINEMQDDYNSEEYSFEQPFIRIDPFERNSLSAYVAVPINHKASYEYTVLGKDEYTDFTIESDKVQSDVLVIPIVGLYENYDNTIEVSVKYGNGEVEDFEVSINTDELDESIVDKFEPDFSDSSRQEASDGFEDGLLFTSTGNAYDVNGDIRVALGSEDNYTTANPINLNDDGSFLIDTSDSVESIDLTGRILTEYEMEEGFEPHHDHISASNGYTYVLVSPEVEYVEGQENYNEGHLAVYKTGVSDLPVETIDLNQYFLGNKVNDKATNMPVGTDLIHLNSIAYDEPTNTLILSSQSQNMLFGIDADNYSLQWTSRDEEGDNSDGEKRLDRLKDFVPSSGQHNVQVTHNPMFDDDNDETIELMIFSNGFCLNEEEKNDFTTLDDTVGVDSTCTSADTSQLLVYRVNPSEMTIETIFESSIEDYHSETQSGWTQSPDYKYNYICYNEMGTFVIADEEMNIIYSAYNLVETAEDHDDDPGYGLYRARILTHNQINSIQANADNYRG